jgi:hypothetical protein
MGLEYFQLHVIDIILPTYNTGLFLLTGPSFSITLRAFPRKPKPFFCRNGLPVVDSHFEIKLNDPVPLHSTYAQSRHKVLGEYP